MIRKLNNMYIRYIQNCRIKKYLSEDKGLCTIQYYYRCLKKMSWRSQIIMHHEENSYDKLFPHMTMRCNASSFKKVKEHFSVHRQLFVVINFERLGFFECWFPRHK